MSGAPSGRFNLEPIAHSGLGHATASRIQNKGPDRGHKAGTNSEPCQSFGEILKAAQPRRASIAGTRFEISRRMLKRVWPWAVFAGLMAIYLGILAGTLASCMRFGD